MELKVMTKAAVAPGGGCASSGCGGSDDRLAGLPAAIRAKINNHPCFS
jgi:nitrogen fixation protein NifB